MQQTNPSIEQIPVPQGNTDTKDPRSDKAPYSNLQIRDARIAVTGAQQADGKGLIY